MKTILTLAAFALLSLTARAEEQTLAGNTITAGALVQSATLTVMADTGMMRFYDGNEHHDYFLRDWRAFNMAELLELMGAIDALTKPDSTTFQLISLSEEAQADACKARAARLKEARAVIERFRAKLEKK